MIEKLLSDVQNIITKIANVEYLNEKILAGFDAFTQERKQIKRKQICICCEKNFIDK